MIRDEPLLEDASTGFPFETTRRRQTGALPPKMDGWRVSMVRRSLDDMMGLKRTQCALSGGKNIVVNMGCVGGRCVSPLFVVRFFWHACFRNVER